MGLRSPTSVPFFWTNRFEPHARAQAFCLTVLTVLQVGWRRHRCVCFEGASPRFRRTPVIVFFFHIFFEKGLTSYLG